MKLSSRFSNVHSIRSESPLQDDQLQSVVPSIYAENAHASRSDRYLHIPTSTILDALRKQGFEPFMACQARVRDETKYGFAKHMLRLRHVSQLNASTHNTQSAASNNGVNEIILLNSHDGSSSYQMMAGCYRYVCQNGMICGETFQDVRVQHRGNIVDNVIEGAYSVLENFERVSESRAEMADIHLSGEEKVAFAKAALPLRFSGPEKPAEQAVLSPRRSVDAKDDLWTVFNVVQENLVRGGIRTLTQKGKISRTRKINGIDGNVRLNKALWTLAESMAQIKLEQAA